MEIGVDITDKKNLENFILSKILETEENDRKRFAIDLHDDLGPTLSAIKIQLSLLEKVKTSKERKELLEICYQLLSESIDKMRTVANNIMPNLIESYGLETAVKSFIHRIEKTCQIKFKFKSNLKGSRIGAKIPGTHLYYMRTGGGWAAANEANVQGHALLPWRDLTVDQEARLRASQRSRRCGRRGRTGTTWRGRRRGRSSLRRGSCSASGFCKASRNSARDMSSLVESGKPYIWLAGT